MGSSLPGALPEGEQLRRLVEHASDLIYRYRLTPELYCEYVSPAVFALTGYTQAEHYADPQLLLKLLHPGDRGLLQFMIERDNSSRAILTRWIRRDGTLIWVEQRTRVEHDAAGAPIALEGIARDVSDRRHTEEALSQALDAERHARYIAEVLHSANLSLTHSLDAEQVMAALLDHLGRLVPYDSANVMLHDSSGELVIKAARGYQRFRKPDMPPLAPDSLTGAAVLQPILERRRSFLVMDTALTPRWQDRPGCHHIRNWFGVPLLAGDQLIGIFCLDKVEPAFFTPEHVDLAELLSTPAAIALQNARLFAEVATGRERMRALSERLVAVQEAERAHLARELHDEIGQMLTSLSLALTMHEQMPALMLRERIGEVQRQINQLTAQVRTLSLNLRPAMLDDLGLLPALIWFTRRYSDQTGIQVQLQHAGLEGLISPTIGATAYRVVQEALTNVARHAHVDRVRVQVWTTDAILAVQVVDQGCGFVVAPDLIAYNSSGLVGMQERVSLAGGMLTIESQPGEGTRILAELPLDSGGENQL